jgi:DNA-binding NtrC family response regulator
MNVFPIEIPALRQRVEDIPLLVDFFLKQLQEVQPKVVEGLDPRVLDAFGHYSWPGNVRELENLLERAFILERSNMLTPASFPAELFSSKPAIAPSEVDISMPLSRVREKVLSELERQYLEAVLRQSQGRIKVTAKAAGVGVRQLHKLLCKHRLRKEEFR